MFPLRTLVLAAAAVTGMACAPSAFAAVIVSQPEFELIETNPSADTGQYTLVNNSSDLWVYGFTVGNPNAGIGAEAFTTQPNWTPSTSGPSDSAEGFFEYLNSDFTTLALDVGPHSSSSQFTWGPDIALASPVTIDTSDSNGNLGTVNIDATDVPEPASLALLGAGLGMFGLARRRRSKADRGLRAV